MFIYCLFCFSISTRYINEQAFADEMNDFYRRFDTQYSSSRCDSVPSDVFVINADNFETLRQGLC